MAVRLLCGLTFQSDGATEKYLLAIEFPRTWSIRWVSDGYSMSHNSCLQTIHSNIVIKVCDIAAGSSLDLEPAPTTLFKVKIG